MLIYYKWKPIAYAQEKKFQCIPGTEKTVNMKEDRLMLRCTCANCGILKHSFVK